MMKRRCLCFLLIGYLCLLSGCKNKKTDSVTDTTLDWVGKTHNFGDLSEGEEACHSFYFTNTGDQQLLIQQIETGCGCTTVKYKKSPIPPGKKEKIEITFNSAGRYGKQYKEIRIFANIPEKGTVLSFTANVK